MSEAASTTDGGAQGGGSPFSYTQRSYWGGPWYPYWSLVLVTVVGGFFGIDHLYLRSPSTALAKMVLNVLGLGMWWFYDMIQICGEKDNVMKYGLSLPVTGAAGIGSGMFTDDQPTAKRSKSPLRYLAYMYLVMLPFGFDFLAAGDTYGAAAKFLSSILFFMWPIAAVWTIMNAGTAFFAPKTLFESGTYRMFPWSFVMDKEGPSVLGPKDTVLTDVCEEPGLGGGLFGFFMKVFTTVLGPVINVLAPGLIPAGAAVTTAVKTSANVVTAGEKLAAGVLDAARDPASKITAVTVDLAQKAPGAVAAIPGMAGSIGSSAAQFTSPEALKALATKKGTQVGGGLIGGGSDSSDGMSSLALFGFFLGVLGLGIYSGISRLNIGFPLSSKADKDGQPRNDYPPEPRRL